MSNENGKNLEVRVREHLQQIRGEIGYVGEVVSVPNLARVLHRVDFVIAPPLSISPDNIEGLNAFYDKLFVPKLSTNRYTGRFYNTPGGHLMLGRITYKEIVKGGLRSTLVQTIELEDEELLRTVTRAGVELRTETQQKDRPLYRVVAIRPVPSVRMADYVTMHEKGYISGVIAPNTMAMRWRKGLFDTEVEQVARGKFPFPLLTPLPDGVARGSTHSRAQVLEKHPAINDIMGWTNFETD